MSPPRCSFAASFRFLSLRSLWWVALSPLFAAQASGQISSFQPSFDWYGDLRLRFEEDWDSRDASGVPREDRTRGRYRVRLGAKATVNESWASGIRLRTGDSRSQQSPHLTFASDPGGSDEIDGILDKYFVEYKEGDRTFWIGRNSFPFWQQNEFFWDDDVTPTGLAANLANLGGGEAIDATFGAFALPDGGWGLNGSLLSGQIKYTDATPTESGQITVALGLHRFFGKSGADELLANNGARDYFLLNFGSQWLGDLNGRRLALGLDVFKNLKSYSAAELAPYSLAHADEDLGYVLSAQLGALKDAGDWQLGYYYAHIETFAVNASYAQDDWARFGTATQTASSDCKGHELRLTYAFSPTLNLVSRLFVVDAITSDQDGKRFRTDLNWKF